jgi:hypothetical protein
MHYKNIAPMTTGFTLGELETSIFRPKFPDKIHKQFQTVPIHANSSDP